MAYGMGWGGGGSQGEMFKNLLGRLGFGGGGPGGGGYGGYGGGGGYGQPPKPAPPPPVPGPGASQADWAAYFQGQPLQGDPGYTVNNALVPTAATFLKGYTPVQNTLIPQAYGTLAQILQSQGATDPALLNRTLNDISLGTSANQTAMQEQLAKYGLSGSGVGQALSGAIQQAGVGQRAGVLANEAQLQEQRKRTDLESLFQQLLLDPSFNILALERGQYQAGKAGPSDLEQILGSALGGAGTALQGSFHF